MYTCSGVPRRGSVKIAVGEAALSEDMVWAACHAGGGGSSGAFDRVWRPSDLSEVMGWTAGAAGGGLVCVSGCGRRILVDWRKSCECIRIQM